MAMMLSDLQGSLPATPKEVTESLKKLGWGPAMINNTMAYADGRKIFFKRGQWHLMWVR